MPPGGFKRVPVHNHGSEDTLYQRLASLDGLAALVPAGHPLWHYQRRYIPLSKQ